MNPTPPVVLTFAGTDPTSGAGLQADILTLSSIGCHPASVVTAVTVQDTLGVDNVMVFDPEWVEEQARAVLEDMEVGVFKLGMLGSVENVAIIAEILADYPDVLLVMDTVLASGRGDELATEEMQEAMRDLLLPQASIITPNSIEARRLAFFDDSEEDEENASLDECAKRLLEMGCEHVMITGTHERSLDVTNTLYGHKGHKRSWQWERLPGSYHGSGCTLASAIAACLAHGLTMEEAVAEAQEYTWATLKGAFRPGMGQYIPDRLFWARDEDQKREDEDHQH
ncbi:hydroxymethylpyrimidine/phosphomethylpyrimidine kinase [Novimethylophilus kurashikiensis]|uniref:hydroxymethylpyrimidine kinase n=1 Tax=Novimethylophilus kurashikiensis TaxID=1825523 RepID=A0A2R5F5W7_9PROT|nr:bifunctional hydroxymethylpyrimidine kinase/phosphomethylpyrimidine kinase [Novimethylophilus kurashikiensis]GBG13712.1 hydroxymethylpyrimidine/phosphomethylpyrimidine kinase [Novimethylophilus kurashikiensis]